ncbi:hypothetical protein BC828DRAFT_376556 [Blastocladiella britannica]|nr:hypothetical protein BC828DRAFT_376556 [Blastocladiella britannica]
MEREQDLNCAQGLHDTDADEASPFISELDYTTWSQLPPYTPSPALPIAEVLARFPPPAPAFVSLTAPAGIPPPPPPPLPAIDPSMIEALIGMLNSGTNALPPGLNLEDLIGLLKSDPASAAALLQSALGVGAPVASPFPSVNNNGDLSRSASPESPAFDAGELPSQQQQQQQHDEPMVGVEGGAESVAIPYSTKSSAGIPYSILDAGKHAWYLQLSSRHPSTLSLDEGQLLHQLEKLVQAERQIADDFYLTLQRSLADSFVGMFDPPPAMAQFVQSMVIADLQSRWRLLANIFHLRTSWDGASDPAPQVPTLEWSSTLRLATHLPTFNFEHLSHLTIPLTPPSLLLQQDWRIYSLPPVSLDPEFARLLRQPSASGNVFDVTLALGLGTLTSLCETGSAIAANRGAPRDAVYHLTVASSPTGKPMVMIEKPVAPPSGPHVALAPQVVRKKYLTAATRRLAATAATTPACCEYTEWTIGPSMHLVVRARIDTTQGERVKVDAELMVPPLPIANAPPSLPTGSIRPSPRRALANFFRRGRTVSVRVDARSGRVLGIAGPQQQQQQQQAPPETATAYVVAIARQLAALPAGHYVLGYQAGMSAMFVMAAGPDPGSGESMVDWRFASAPPTIVCDPQLASDALEVLDWTIADSHQGVQIPGTFPIMPSSQH